MNKLQDKEILHQVYYERYKTNEALKLLSIVDKANKDIAIKLRKTKGVYSKKRYTEIAKYLNDISKNVRSQLEDGIDIDGTIEEEIESQVQILKGIVGGKANVNLPSPKQVHEAVMFRPTAGVTFSSFLDRTQEGLFTIWDNAVRVGYMTGQTTDDIVRSVLGSVNGRIDMIEAGTIQTLRNSLMSNTRTQLQSIANEARMETYEENDDLFDGYQWFSTLDRRSCLVCGNLDGKIFAEKKDVPIMPVHMNCRCILLPHFKNDELNQIGKRASEFGEVDGDVTYKKWFEEQSEETKKDILGAGKYELYKNNVYKVQDFVNGNKVMSLNELKGTLNAKKHSPFIVLHDDNVIYAKVYNYSQMNAKEKDFAMCSWLLRKQKESNVERCICYDEKGNILDINKGTRNNVGYSNRFLRIMKNDNALKFSFVHNHPNGSGLSEADILRIVSNDKIISGSCVNGNGTKFTLSRGNGSNLSDLLDEEFIKIYGKYYEKGIKKFIGKSAKVSLEDYELVFDYLLGKLAKKFNWVYSMSKLGD